MTDAPSDTPPTPPPPEPPPDHREFAGNTLTDIREPDESIDAERMLNDERPLDNPWDTAATPTDTVDTDKPDLPATSRIDGPEAQTTHETHTPSPGSAQTDDSIITSSDVARQYGELSPEDPRQGQFAELPPTKDNELTDAERMLADETGSNTEHSPNEEYINRAEEVNATIEELGGAEQKNVAVSGGDAHQPHPAEPYAPEAVGDTAIDPQADRDDEHVTPPPDAPQANSNDSGNTEPAHAEQTQPATDAYSGRIDTAPAEPSEDASNGEGQDSATDTLAELDDRLRNYLDQSQVTPAGRGFYDPHDTEMRQAAQDVPPAPGQYTVDMHGNPARVCIGGESLSPDDLGSILEHDPNWNGQPVRLFACETGRGDDGFGQLLADRLNVDVTAPTELAWSEPDGTIYVTSKDVDIFGNPTPTTPHDGNWRTFHPRINESKEA
ncbi:MAG: hypothetical protein ACRDRS_06725 [Pseudonocardiaceae bacterium]